MSKLKTPLRYAGGKTRAILKMSKYFPNLVKNRFSLDKWKAYEYTHTYTMRSVGDYMRNQQERKELLLLNYDV